MPSSLCCQSDGILQMQLILTLTVWGMMGQVSIKGLRKSVAKALTRRQVLTVKAATEADPDLQQSWGLFVVSLPYLGWFCAARASQGCEIKLQKTVLSVSRAALPAGVQQSSLGPWALCHCTAAAANAFLNQALGLLFEH